MTAQSAQAFFLSAALHALGAGALIVLSLVFQTKTKEPVKIFELVAGAGDNYRATVAPALGSPDVKFDATKLASPKAEPIAPVTPKIPPVPLAPAPVAEKAPVQKVPAKIAPKTPPKERTMAQDLRRKLIVAESRAKLQVKKEREAEQKRLTKAEFDRASRAKADAKNAPPKIARIDAKGIASGVVGGSTKNMTGGAGGKALTTEQMSEKEGYISLLQQELKERLDQTPGLEDGLKAEAELHIMPDGRLTRGLIIKSSGNEAFDLAVLAAIRSVRLPPRPKGVDEIVIVPFATQAKGP